jgi:fused signal recognition particle receptor
MRRGGGHGPSSPSASSTTTTLQELEDLLIQADLGVETAGRIADALPKGALRQGHRPEEVSRHHGRRDRGGPRARRQAAGLDLREEAASSSWWSASTAPARPPPSASSRQAPREGPEGDAGAGDTFRAAAIEQLKIWGERTGAEGRRAAAGADAAGLAFDALKQAKGQGADVLIIDTAGRLQNKAELMAELEKIVRVLGKLDPDARTRAADARRHHRPERAEPGRDLPQDVPASPAWS